MGERPYAYIAYGYRIGSEDIGWHPQIGEWLEDSGMEVHETIEAKIAEKLGVEERLAFVTAGFWLVPTWAQHSSYFLTINSYDADWDSSAVIERDDLYISDFRKQEFERAVAQLGLVFKEEPKWHLFADLR